MKLQNRFEYDPTLLGIDGKYKPLRTDSFLLDMNCIQVKGHIVQTGETYFFLERKPTKSISTTFVKLIDVFFHDGDIYLMIIDLITGKVMLPSHALDNVQNKCQWKLVDSYSMEIMIDDKYHN